MLFRSEGGRLTLLRARLLAREQLDEEVRRDWEALRVDRGRDQVCLEVVELELRSLADQLEGSLRILHAWELDHDLVRALLADLGLRHAELVDAAAHDRNRAVERLRIERPALRRDRLEDHLETTLEVETELRLLLRRRAGDTEQGDAAERAEDQREEEEMGS